MRTFRTVFETKPVKTLQSAPLCQKQQQYAPYFTETELTLTNFDDMIFVRM